MTFKRNYLPLYTYTFLFVFLSGAGLHTYAIASTTSDKILCGKLNNQNIYTDCTSWLRNNLRLKLININSYDNETKDDIGRTPYQKYQEFRTIAYMCKTKFPKKKEYKIWSDLLHERNYRMLNPHVANEQYNSLKGKINKIKDNKLKKQFMDFISGIRIKDEDKNAILRMFQGQEGNPKVWAKKLKKYSIDIKNYCTMKHSHSSYYTNTLGSDRASAERYIETIKGIKQITKLTEEKEEVLNKIFSLLNQLKFAINSLKECLSLKGDTSNPKFNRFQKLSIQAEAYCPAAFKSLTTGPQKLQ